MNADRYALAGKLVPGNVMFSHGDPGIRLWNLIPE